MNDENRNSNHPGMSNAPQDPRPFKMGGMDMNAMLDEQMGSLSSSQRKINVTSKNDDASLSIKNETSELDSFQSKNQEEIDGFYHESIDKRWTLWTRFINNGMFHQVQEVKKDLIKTSSNYRLAYYKTMLDTRLDYMNEKCNAGIKMVKGHYRHQVSSFLMGKMEQLSFEVRDRQFNFLEMMKTKYSYSETLTAYPTMQERYVASIFNEEEKYLKFLDGLLDKFQSIVDEELNKYN